MPEPIPFPKQPTVPIPPSSSEPPDTPKPPFRIGLAGWRLVALVIAIGAVALISLLVHISSHHTAALPTWPLHNGDVLTLTPGNANIAKWAQNPLATGFVVQQLESAGQPVTGTKICALEPDYMADAQQPGGTLTLLNQQPAQQPTGDWRVRWTGGDTLPPFIKQKGDFDANCGTNTILLMTSAQLHSFLNILAGIADSAPPAAPPTPSK